MESMLIAAAQAVSLEPPYDSVFGPLVGDLIDAVVLDDPATFLTAVEGQARLLAGQRRLRMSDIFQGIQLGMEAFRGALEGASPEKAQEARERLLRLEGEALLRAGVGYSEGLEETVEHLSQAVAALSPNDPLTGLMKPDEILRLMAVELDRCKRMNVSLGVFALSMEKPKDAGAPAGMRDWDEFLRSVGTLLRESLRRYDAIGHKGETEFLAVLPDVSRRGLQSVIERIRHGLAQECPAAMHVNTRYACIHLDVVDLAPADVLESIDGCLVRAGSAPGQIAWA